MVEWAGVLVVVAVLIAGVVAFAPGLATTLGHNIECLIAEIFGGRCPTAAKYRVSSSTKTVGYDGRVAFVDGGHGYTLTLTKYSDGSATITVVNTGSLGASAEVGAGAELGHLGGAKADASIGGGGYGDKTSTWTFPSWSAAQTAWTKISQGNGLGLAAHDGASAAVGSLPLIGSIPIVHNTLTGWFDDLTGAKGAPGDGSLPKQYLSSTAVGAGGQGSANASAGVDFGPLSADVSASLAGNAGLEHITSGPQKGDWQLAAGLDGNAGGSLAAALFGDASAAGNITASAVVTFSPSGKPQQLEITASGDGVWDVGPPSNDITLKVPGKSSSGSQSSGSDAGSKASSSKEPLLSVESQSGGGSGVGTSFDATLDLTSDPQAVADLQSLLRGDPTKVGALIADVNSNGVETVQGYKISRSDSSWGAQVSAGVGGGAQISDGGSTVTYNSPKTRKYGGQWQNVTG